MKLSRLTVENYRGLKQVSIPLENFVCIIGENNAGKSSVLQALSLMITGNSLKRSDFYDSSKEVVFTLELEEIDGNDVARLDVSHRNEVADKIIDGKLTLVRKYNLEGKSSLGYMTLYPKEERFAEATLDTCFSKKKPPELRQLVAEMYPEIASAIANPPTITNIKECIKSLITQLPDDVKSLQFKANPTGISNGIAPLLPERIYIPASKDLMDDTKTGETSHFGKILSIVMRSIEPALEEEGRLFANLSAKITRIYSDDGSFKDDRLSEIREIEEKIETYVRQSFANVSLEIEIAPPDLKTVLSTARILAHDGVRGPLELKGDGLRRAVVFAILRSYAEFERESRPLIASDEARERGFLLLFEEPELYLHPDAQKMLFDALAVFSQRHYVVATTHSPIFLAPNVTASFIKLSKNTEEVPVPATRSHCVSLKGTKEKDEFQLICFENNNAAFFSKRIVLVEGDSDYIVFPHVSKLLNDRWDHVLSSTSFVRVNGKMSIKRYKNFFRRFDVPVYVITDLDAIVDGFSFLEAGETGAELHAELLSTVDRYNTINGIEPVSKGSDIKSAHGRGSLRQLWENVKETRAKFEIGLVTFDQLSEEIDAFFTWEKKSIRLSTLKSGVDPDVLDAKMRLIDYLRSKDIFVLCKGCLEDYYPEDIMKRAKPEQAQSLCASLDSAEKALEMSDQQYCSFSDRTASEFEHIFNIVYKSVAVQKLPHNESSFLA